MSIFAKSGTTSECEKFSIGTVAETKVWWYHGATETEAKELLASDKPFIYIRRLRNADVHLSTDEGGCRHKMEHTHVVRARVHFAKGEYSIETREFDGILLNEHIREGELWLKTRHKDHIMLDREFGVKLIVR